MIITLTWLYKALDRATNALFSVNAGQHSIVLELPTSTPTPVIKNLQCGYYNL